MLDHRGDKHQASATPCIISRLKTRHSDKKTVSRQVIANPNWGAKRPGAGRVSVREGMKPKAKNNDVQIVSQAIKK